MTSTVRVKHDNYQDNYSTVGGNGGCRVSEVRAGTTFVMPNHKSFKLQKLPEIHPLHFWVNFQKFSTLRVTPGKEGQKHGFAEQGGGLFNVQPGVQISYVSCMCIIVYMKR